ncbi:MAG: hypothetical protein ABI647_18375 [Gemmatimonadota bacterium]
MVDPIQVEPAYLATGAAPDQFRLSEIISALSFALDLTEGQAIGHSARSCVIGMRLARELGLSSTERSDLFYALLLKDAGCSSNAARLAALFGGDDHELKRDHKLIDWAALLPAAGYAFSHTAPEASTWERVRRIAKIAASAEEIGRDMIASSSPSSAGLRCSTISGSSASPTRSSTSRAS